jgi:flagellar basal-body rod modification protein FlgD
MAVDAISTTIPLRQADSVATATKTDDATQATLDYNSFLKLFMEQLKNQDPTEPMDTTEQMAQLATYSQVEQTIKTNTHMTELLSETRLAQASSWIGKTVTNSDGSVTGVVTEIKVTDSGLTATLKDGNTLEISSGVTVSQ